MGQPKKGDKTISLGDLLRKRGNLLAKDLDGQKEVVSGAPERRNVEKVFTQVLEVLQQDVKILQWQIYKHLFGIQKKNYMILQN